MIRSLVLVVNVSAFPDDANFLSLSMSDTYLIGEGDAGAGAGASLTSPDRVKDVEETTNTVVKSFI